MNVHNENQKRNFHKDLWTLLYFRPNGRFEGRKDAFGDDPEVMDDLKSQVRLVFAGDGVEREILQARAQYLEKQYKSLRIEFTGWIDQKQFDLLIKCCDLLIVPSLCPEPFGMAGLEAGLKGSRLLLSE